MALKPLNSVAGFSVGETPANIILANGDITTTNITTTGVSNLNAIGNVKISGGSNTQVIQTDGAGNLSFVTISTSSLSNGNSNIQVLANGNVTFSVTGTANVGTFTSTGLNVAGYISGSNITANGNVSVNNYIVTPSTVDLIVAPDTQITRFYSNVNPFSGGYSLGNSLARWDNVFANTANVAGNVSAGNVLTDNLLYANGQPWDLQEAAGANTEIQYNLGDNFAASANFTYNDATQLFTVLGNSQFNNANLGNLAIANFINVASNVTASNITVNLELSGNTANFTGNVEAGNLSTSGSGGNITMTGGNIIGANVVIANSFTSNGGTIDFATNNPNVNLGNVGNVHITGGSANQYLQTDGTGNLTWTTANTSGISNGTSNVSIPVANGNVITSVDGNANIFVVTGTGANVTGTLDVTANLTAANANLGNLVTANYGNFSSNVVAGNLISNALTSTRVPYVGVGNNLTDSTNLTWDNPNQVLNVGAGGTQLGGDAGYGYIQTTTGNFSGNITSLNANLGNLATANIINANVINANSLNTGLIANGTSNIRIDQDGNITLSSNNLSNVFTFSDVGANVVGYVTANGNGTFGALYSNTLTAQGGNLELSSEQAGNSYIQLRTFGDGTVDVGNVRITSLAMPNASTDAATKQYVDDVAQGLNIHDSALAATTNTLASLTGGVITYNNGASGVGANLVLSGTPTANYLSANVFDGNVTAVANSRILVKNEANAAFNGIYVVSNSTVLTRADDFNSVPEIEPGDFVFVQDGTTYNDSGWVQTSSVTTVGTDPIIFTQFSGAGTYQAGAGLTLTGTVFSVNVDNITTEISGGNVIVKANAQFTTPNIGAATGTSVDLTGNLIAGNLNSNAMITTVDLNASGNILTNNLTVNSVFSGNSANFSGNLVVNNLTVNLELAGNTANFTGNINSALNANLGNLVTANFANITSNVTTSNLTVNLELAGNTANFTGNVRGANLTANSYVFAPAIVQNASTYDTRISLSSAAGIIEANIGGNATQFLPGGQIRLSGAATIYGGTLDGSQLVLGTAQTDLVQNRSGNVTVQTGTGGTTANTWTFAQDGNLYAPGAFVANVVKANVSVLVGNSSITWGNVTTTAITANQTISSYTLTSSGVTGVEWLVKGVDDNLVTPKYSVATVQAVTDGTNVDYTIYGTVNLGGTTGMLAVNVVGSSLRLQVTPSSSNSTAWVTQYRTI